MTTETLIEVSGMLCQRMLSTVNTNIQNKRPQSRFDIKRELFTATSPVLSCRSDIGPYKPETIVEIRPHLADNRGLRTHISDYQKSNSLFCWELHISALRLIKPESVSGITRNLKIKASIGSIYATGHSRSFTYHFVLGKYFQPLTKH